MGGPILIDQWCYSCDNKTVHEVRFVSDITFVGKLIVCTMCGERNSEPPIGVLELSGDFDPAEDEDWTTNDYWDEGEDEG